MSKLLGLADLGLPLHQPGLELAHRCIERQCEPGNQPAHRATTDQPDGPVLDFDPCASLPGADLDRER